MLFRYLYIFFPKKKIVIFYSHSADGPHSPLYKIQLRSSYLQKFASEGAQNPQSISKTDPTEKLSLHTIYHHKIIMFTKNFSTEKKSKSMQKLSLIIADLFHHSLLNQVRSTESSDQKQKNHSRTSMLMKSHKCMISQ